MSPTMFSVKPRLVGQLTHRRGCGGTGRSRITLNLGPLQISDSEEGPGTLRSLVSPSSPAHRASTALGLTLQHCTWASAEQRLGA